MGKKVVLAIDDDEAQLAIFKSMLDLRFDLRTANSASNALAFLNEEHVDVILLDITMPNIDGLHFLDDIKKVIRYMDTPIIIVSSMSGGRFLDEAKQSGAFDVLSKPVKLEAIIDTIERALVAAAAAAASLEGSLQ